MEVRTYRLFIRHQLVAVRRKKAEQHKIVRISPFYTHTKLTRKNARNAELSKTVQVHLIVTSLHQIKGFCRETHPLSRK